MHQYRSLDAAVSLVLVLTILVVAAGSSSVGHAAAIGRPARWWLLGLLALLSVAYARGTPLPRRLPFAAVVTGAFVVLAIGSLMWSAAPSLTLQRTSSFVLLLVSATLLAFGARGDPARAERLLFGLLGGAVAVGLVSLLVWVGDPSVAGSLHARFRGFGQQPTTDAMLYALALPIALYACFRAPTRRTLVVAGAAVVLLDGLLILSGSRGPEGGALLALAILALATRGIARIAGGALFAATLALALTVAFVQTHQSVGPPATTAPAKQAAPVPYPRPGYLSEELGSRSNDAVIRSLLGTSGRTDAWRGALKRANRRPFLGWGFGTEDRVFENHYDDYQGNLVGSSWVGLYLQLGAIGTALIVALWLGLGAAAVHAVRRRNLTTVGIACAAVAAAALPIMFVESWLYAAGNLVCLPFWLAALLLSTLGVDSESPKRVSHGFAEAARTAV